MADIVNYHEILYRIVYGEGQQQPRFGQVRLVPVCDQASGQYLLVAIGWENKQRVDSVVFHAQIQDGHIVIETDNTEEGLKHALIAAGIPADAIRPASAWYAGHTAPSAA